MMDPDITQIIEGPVTRKDGKLFVGNSDLETNLSLWEGQDITLTITIQDLKGAGE